MEEPFTLALGESVSVGGDELRLRFDSVLEDSRCPKDVQCVRAGNARVQLEVALGTAAPATVELNTAGEPRDAEVGGFLLVLETLAPYPDSGRPTRPEDYRATLSLHRP